MAQNNITAAGTEANIKSYLTPSSPTGINLQSLSLTGDIDAVGVFDSVVFRNDFSLLDRGVLITSGTGLPSRTNTSTSKTTVNGALGDADLTAFASKAFNGAGATQDATVLTLNIFVSSPGVKSVKFDLAFGSEEFPEYSNTKYVDIAAVWTGTGTAAKNYGLVNGKADQPLSVITKNTTSGNFVDNASGGFAIEYDGLIKKQTVYVPVQQGLNTIKIGIADTGDSSYDFGLFITGLEGSSQESGGTFQETEVDKGGKFDAGDANNIFTGLPKDFANTVFSFFDDLDALFFTGTFFSDLKALLNLGSMVIRLDTDGNGTTDTKVTLADPVLNGTLTVEKGKDGTTVTIDPLKQGNSKSQTINGTADFDYIAGKGGNDKIDGKGASDVLLGGEGKDKLFGGRGADTLFGGKGADDLHAGGGDFKDTFVFKAKSDFGKTQSTWDQIYDFDAKSGTEKISDKIDLRALDLKWSDIDISTKGDHVKVMIDWKGGSSTDAVIQVMDIGNLHKADFLL